MIVFLLRWFCYHKGESRRGNKNEKHSDAHCLILWSGVLLSSQQILAFLYMAVLRVPCSGLRGPQAPQASPHCLPPHILLPEPFLQRFTYVLAPSLAQKY